MSDKSGVSSQVISLPKGGGALHGIGEKFSPDLHTGTGNFTVPIALPHGRNGFQPQLNLVYSTGNGNGAFGLGWNLSIPGISRQTSKGIPRYDEQKDIFVLSGAEDLVPVSNPEPGITRYRPRTEGLFALIDHHQEPENDYWEVKSKDGLVSFYGKGSETTDVAAIANPNNPSQIFVWKLTETTDPFGNRIVYKYFRDTDNSNGHHGVQLYLQQIQYIDYGDRANPQFLVSVTFDYEDKDRPDTFSEYRAGFEIRTRKRCHQIVVRMSSAQESEQTVRTYQLVYLDQRQDLNNLDKLLPLNRASLLSQIWVKGQDNAIENLLKNSNFEIIEQSGSTTFSGLGFADITPAANWRLWLNESGTLTAQVLPSTFPLGGNTMIHVATNGLGNGLVQIFLPQNTGPVRTVAAAWVFVKKGRVGIGTGNNGNTQLDVISSTKNQWEYLEATNGVSPANQFIIYSASEGGAEFYVASASVSEAIITEWLPPLEFGYTRFEPQGRNFFPLTGADLPPGSLARPEYELADLFGNGLPDILEMNGTVRYWRNLGNGKFDRPRSMKDAPAGLQLADPGVQMIDADGDGRIDLLVSKPGLSGYFPLRFGKFWDRKSFQRYEVAPSFNLEDPEVKLVDLTGDGVTDAIRSGSRLECFFNDPKAGWKETKWVDRKQALAKFPTVNFSDPRVKWGDMTGDGLQDILLVHDGNIEYWPNLGYGNWGDRISMKNSPRYRYGYDPKRILVGDVDGDGLADIVYVDDKKVILWINQSGNGWSDPIEIKGTPPVSDMDAVRLVDLLGTGISGVLWSADAGGLSRQSMFFLDFTGGVKPYLLNEMDNHMGSLTRVGYAPSVKFYLEDEKRPETRWKTALPFPVQVVAKVEVIDHFSKGKLTTEYCYHHGYWDGGEREFRGFGRVEQRDTEIFDEFHAPGLHSDRFFESVAPKMFSPPLETRTWFHQGPVGDEFGEWYELDYRDEFWAGDPQVLARPESVENILKGLSRRAKRDAFRSLRGTILRTELYALDRTDRQDKPYTVTESVHGVRVEFLPTEHNRDLKPILFPFALAERTTQWERGDEPMTQFKFMGNPEQKEGKVYTYGYDRYGQPLYQLSIAVPRNRNFREEVVGNTSPYLSTYSETTYAQRDDDQRFIVDRVARTTTYEILNDGTSTVFQLKDTVDNGSASRKIIGQTVNFYDGAAFVGADFGKVEDYGALVRSLTLAMTEENLQAAYGTNRPPYLSNPVNWTEDYPQDFKNQLNQLPERVGYVLKSGGAEFAEGYFIIAEQRQYDFQETVDKNRGLVMAMRDPLGRETGIQRDKRETSIQYDSYDLLPTKVTDPVGLTTEAEYDYRLLQPKRVTDANANQTEFRFTPLGLLKESWVKGKPDRTEGDRDRPSILMEYGFMTFENSPAENRQPIFVRSLWLTHHDTETDVPQPKRDETITNVEYSDGFGRLLQTRTQAEEVLFGNSTFGGEILPLDQNDEEGTRLSVVGKENIDPNNPNVVVSGWQIYDNKGRVVEKYEPFYSTGWDYLAPLDEQKGQKVKMFYDPRGQVIRTLNPDGSEQRVIYGVPEDLAKPDQFNQTPWEAYTYDANDLAPLCFSLTETLDDGSLKSLSDRAPESHHYTPASIEIDPLGRTIKAVERNGSNPDDWYITLTTYDIRGNVLKINDALRRDAFEHVYDLANRKLWIKSIDAGMRWMVLDAIANPVEQWDLKGVNDPAEQQIRKGALTLHAYDRLNRPTHLWARDGLGQDLTLRERLIYGDGGEPDQPDSEREANRQVNRLGKPFQHFDEAGMQQFEVYDFKGNLLEKGRRVIRDERILAVFDDAPANNWNVNAYRVNWEWENVADTLLEDKAYTTSMEYDALNRVKRMRYPQDVENKRRTLYPTYNRSGALETVKMGFPRADGTEQRDLYVERIAYNAKGQRVLIAYGNGVITRHAYDPQTFRLGRLRSQKYDHSDNPLTYRFQGAPLQDFGYEYDLVGNITKIRDRTPESGIPNTQLGTNALDRLFEYEPIYRLISAMGRECDLPPESPPWADEPRCTDLTKTRAHTELYEYDKVGNIKQLTHQVNGFNRNRIFALKDGNNRLDTVTVGQTVYQYTYDNNGNLIQENGARHFEWDYADRMRVFRTQTENAEPSVHAHYLYDASGQRVKKLVRKQGGQIEVTVYIDSVFEYQRIGQGGEPRENNMLHVMDNQSRIALVRVGNPFPDDTTPTVKYHLSDHLGSSNVVIDDSGGLVNREEYTPYGETSFGSFARKRYRFTGKERDEESGLNYHGARYYAPWLVRWTSCDPAGPVDGPNLYAYTRNPLSFTDPQGTDPQCKTTTSTDFAVPAEASKLPPGISSEGSITICKPPSVSQPSASAASSSQGGSARPADEPDIPGQMPHVPGGGSVPQIPTTEAIGQSEMLSVNPEPIQSDASSFSQSVNDFREGLLTGLAQAVPIVGWFVKSSTFGRHDPQTYEIGRGLGQIGLGIVEIIAGGGMFEGGGGAAILGTATGPGELVIGPAGILVATAGAAIAINGAISVSTGIQTIAHAMSTSGGSTVGSAWKEREKIGEEMGDAAKVVEDFIEENGGKSSAETIGDALRRLARNGNSKAAEWLNYLGQKKKEWDRLTEIIDRNRQVPWDALIGPYKKR
ncbi:MAG: VCBS repeat-containing protein [Chlorogloeopsis fritschii C42_A2020_084]|uniref:SpvB/TcaC N-terminal domain-containing protein n=1 Tax=Chlorogloeopsis fritschii TaxID=1124 RepID=UPI001A054C2B|nr:SpvB/TcaC N-terminal domain-containing protein [Chlorogloeopsis fritschii]MBF2009493.1 VCBS repeat-containing protein [Chlorogloeopsis fritschii C42_A2020_084]